MFDTVFLVSKAGGITEERKWQGQQEEKENRKVIVILVVIIIAIGAVAGYFIWQNLVHRIWQIRY